MESNGEMMLVVQYDLPMLLYRAPLPHVLCSTVSVFVSGGKSEACFSLALGEKKRGHPYSLVPSRRLCAQSVLSMEHKEGGKGGVGVIITAKGQARHRLSDPLLR